MTKEPTVPHYQLPHDLGQALIDYLGARPYREVRELVERLQRLEVVPEPELEPAIKEEENVERPNQSG